MSEATLPIHIRFAIGEAMYGLEQLIKHFDFRSAVFHHAYSGIPEPNELFQIIDGFLTEGPALIPGGSRNQLIGLRQIVFDTIKPAYEAGWKTASVYWETSKPKYGETAIERVQEMAFEKAMDGSIETNWFVEGYCRAWAMKEMEAVTTEANPASGA
jgi:hypothetical protein